MLDQHPFSKSEKYLLFGSLLVLLFSFFYQLGIYPLYLEEPRRGIISLEMIFQNNYWVPTQTGDLYFRKPPVYNWLLIGSYKLFGEYSEFATRFFSVLSHILLSLITFSFVKRYLGQYKAALIAISLLVSADILVYFSTIGEIDLFYALITTTSLFAVYFFGEQKRYWTLFVVVYVLTAVGFLTKGLTSLPFTAITLLVYFIHKKQFKELLKPPHIAGIFVFSGLVGGYFFIYSQYQDVSGWWSTLLSESADKATKGGFVKFLNHLVAFPLETIKNIMPAGLLLPLLFSKGLVSKLRSNPLVWYSVLVFAFNFLVYWFSIEAKSRYIYPLFPFLIIPLIYLATKSKELLWPKVSRVTIIIFLVLLTLIVPFGYFIDGLGSVDNLYAYMTILLVMAAILWYMYLVKKVRPFLIVICLMVAIKFTFSSIVPQTRQKETGAAEDKTLGLEIAEITKGKPLHRLGDVRMSLTIVFYIERERKEPLYKAPVLESGYYICYTDDLPKNRPYTVLREFAYWEEPIFFISLD
ncbi:ArnT family glycosyltransferase [Roseivirga sp.]|uniref:ArnT family glycosyltransferase n=1 Tax=Roseivirga sp. TaxID=1964215 RepID=UPI003B8E2056